MLDEKYKNIVEKATISFEKGGKGILVPGNLIITAAHCVNFNLDGFMCVLEELMPYGEQFFEKIITYSKKEIKVIPLAVEPVSDIAILSSLDGSRFEKESMDYDKFCEETQPVKLCFDEIISNQEYPIYIFTHEFKWITGTAICLNKFLPYILCEMEEPIHNGTSGSAIVNQMGELVGIVSIIQGEDELHMTTGREPYLLKALPAWILYLIQNDIPI